jgi:hypothetical protein
VVAFVRRTRGQLTVCRDEIATLRASYGGAQPVVRSLDGTACPTRDWNHVPDLYSANVSYPGMNLQIAATLDRALIAVGPRPVHGARHDAHGSPR